MSQDLAKPNKALRNTAKAYLKTAEKKLADERAKAEIVKAPTPAVLAPTPAFDTPTKARRGSRVEESIAAGEAGLAEALQVEETGSLKQSSLADQPQPSIEVSLVLHLFYVV